MARVTDIACPQCKKMFYVENSMLKGNCKFHCPYCDSYFFRNDITKEEEDDGQGSN